MNEIVTLDKYFQDFSTKKDRRKEYPNEFTKEIEDQAKKLLEKVNALLTDLGIKSAEVSSGWRPSQINGALSNAAKRSFHMTGKAIDILDNKNQDLAKLVASRPELLKKYGLWMEDMISTRGKYTNWVHLDNGDRSDRPSRVFKV